MARISTPCVNICWTDPDHGLCQGCGRTRDEIASWCFITEEQRLAVMAQLKARLAQTPAAGATGKAHPATTG
jgi:predicted Fe-S protein YdhL (DUF1289 family)